MDMKRDYYEDIQMLPSAWEGFWFVVLLAALALFPLLGGNYYCYLANLIAINAIVAIGLNLLVGYTGQVSLGHAGFFAIGAYTSAMLYGKYGLSILIALPAAGSSNRPGSSAAKNPSFCSRAGEPPPAPKPPPAIPAPWLRTPRSSTPPAARPVLFWPSGPWTYWTFRPLFHPCLCPRAAGWRS
jgi:hypothetical protein